VTSSDQATNNTFWAFVVGAFGIKLNPDFFVINNIQELVGFLAGSASFIYVSMMIVHGLYKLVIWCNSTALPWLKSKRQNKLK